MTKKIENFLTSWAEGVIGIGKIFVSGGSYIEFAEDFLTTHYAFETERVLFKPTFTKEVVFRNAKEEALSYFVKGCIAEDNGFALKPWESITLEELNIVDEEKLIVAMGSLRFKAANSEHTTLVAFTFVFIDVDGALKIKIHHSSPVV